MEQVAALAAEDSLPEPFLSIDTLQPNTPAFSSPYSTYRQAALDPWSASQFGGNGGGTDIAVPRSATTINGGGVTSSLAGSGLSREWWNKQEHVDVTILGQQGFILNRYTVYEIMTEVRVQLYISFECTDMLSIARSAAYLFIVGIRSSYFCGTAWYDVTLSVSYLPFRPSVCSVSVVVLYLRFDAYPTCSRLCIHRATEVSVNLLFVAQGHPKYLQQERPCSISERCNVCAYHLISVFDT